MKLKKPQVPDNFFPVVKKIEKISGGKKAKVPEFLYKFGQKWKINAKIIRNKRGKVIFPKILK